MDRRQFLNTCSTASAGLLAPSLAASAAATRTPRTPIRIGQIGTGHAHSTKLDVYRSNPDFEVVGIVEEDATRRSRLQSIAAFRDVPLMSQEQLLNTPGLQAVLVETEVKDLLDTAETCIDAGKHIHLDKPAGESWPQFQRIVKKAREKQLMIQMGYMYRYNPGIVLLREFLERGWLGDVFEIHTVMSKVIGEESRKQLGEYPGGTMFELGCHIIDLVIGVLGSPDQITPYARHSSDTPDKLVDNMLAVFEYPKATATVRSTAVEVEGFARRHFVVCGTEGTFHIQPLDRPAARVALSKAQGKYRRGYQDITFPKYSRYVGDAADMAAVIRGEKQNDFGYDHDLTVQESVLRASALPLT